MVSLGNAGCVVLDWNLHRVLVNPNRNLTWRALRQFVHHFKTESWEFKKSGSRVSKIFSCSKVRFL